MGEDRRKKLTADAEVVQKCVCPPNVFCSNKCTRSIEDLNACTCDSQGACGNCPRTAEVQSDTFDDVVANLVDFLDGILDFLDGILDLLESVHNEVHDAREEINLLLPPVEEEEPPSESDWEAFYRVQNYLNVPGTTE